MVNSTLVTRPAKPRKSFPLFPHRNGRWAKKVKGKFQYFGKWADDPKGEAAFQLWLDNRDRLLAGQSIVRGPVSGTTIQALCDHFLASKKQRLVTGELSPRTFADYYATFKYLAAAFGKDTPVSELGPEQFSSLRAKLGIKEKGKGKGRKKSPHAVARQITQVRMIFKYAFENGLVNTPVRLGPDFKRPSKKTMRAHRQKSTLTNGKRMFTASQLRQIIATATPQLKAMIMLAVNAGFGNSDCGTLPQTALDFESGWVDYPRPKTAIERRCPLWPETIDALKEAIRVRPAHRDKEHSQLVFLTRCGTPWAKEDSDNPITKAFRKLLDELKLYRPGLGFYAVRHVFATIAGDSRDQVAVNFIMGHCDSSMASVYREGIEDERLRNVVNHVHAWLYPRPTVG